MRPLGYKIEDLESMKVSVDNFDDVLSESFRRTLHQGHIGHLKRDVQGDNIHYDYKVTDCLNAIGYVKWEGVIDISMLSLNILNMPFIDITLWKALDGILLTATVVIFF